MCAWRWLWLWVCVLASPATAGNRAGLEFDLYAGGLHVLKAHIDMAAGAGSYRVQAEIASQGITDFFLRWHSRQTSEGRLADRRARPVLHTRNGEWRFSKRATRLTYDGAGAVSVEVTPPPEEDNRPPVPEALRRDTVDLLSALAQAAVAADLATACSGGARIYDGRRRYDVAFASVGIEPLKRQEYGPFAGPALHCRVTATPLAGFRDASETGLGFPSDVSIWLADTVADGLVLPVRFQAEFEIGTVIGHLARVRPSTALD